MGASGSGKSTLLNILGILDNYDTGEYLLNNVPIWGLSETKAAEYVDGGPAVGLEWRPHEQHTRLPRRRGRRQARRPESPGSRPPAHVRHVRGHRHRPADHGPRHRDDAPDGRRGHAALPPDYGRQSPRVPRLLFRLPRRLRGGDRLRGRSGRRRRPPQGASSLRLPGRRVLGPRLPRAGRRDQGVRRQARDALLPADRHRPDHHRDRPRPRAGRRRLLQGELDARPRRPRRDRHPASRSPTSWPAS